MPRVTVGFELRPLSKVLGAEVVGLDTAATLTPEQVAALRAAWDEHGLLLLREQRLDPDAQIRFSRLFGPLQEVAQKQFQMADRPLVFVIGNAEEGGRRIGDVSVGRLWHSDQSFMPQPALGSLLYGVECPPEGADTLFASAYVAYETLPASLRAEIEGLHGVHSFTWYYEGLRRRDPSQPPMNPERAARYPDVRHPLVRRHRRTGRKALYAAPAYLRGIAERPGEQGQALLDRLFAHQLRDELVHAHRWRPGDLLMWQNVGLVHVATPFDTERYTRRMHRTTVASLADEHAASMLPAVEAGRPAA